MKAKDILKSPLFLITLTLFICLAVAFLIFEVGHENESVGIEDKKFENKINDETGEDTDSKEASSNSTSQTSGSNASSSSAKEYSTKSKYADIELVKEYVLLDSKLDSDEINFISVELNKSSEPPIYEIVFETTNGYRKYIYHANALNGLLRDRTYYNADDVVDEANIFMIKEGQNAKYYDVIWDNSDGYNVPDGKRGSQSFYGDPVYIEGYSG